MPTPSHLTPVTRSKKPRRSAVPRDEDALDEFQRGSDDSEGSDDSTSGGSSSTGSSTSSSSEESEVEEEEAAAATKEADQPSSSPAAKLTGSKRDTVSDAAGSSDDLSRPAKRSRNADGNCSAQANSTHTHTSDSIACAHTLTGHAAPSLFSGTSEDAKEDATAGTATESGWTHALERSLRPVYTEEVRLIHNPRTPLL